MLYGIGVCQVITVIECTCFMVITIRHHYHRRHDRRPSTASLIVNAKLFGFYCREAVYLYIYIYIYIGGWGCESNREIGFVSFVRASEAACERAKLRASEDACVRASEAVYPSESGAPPSRLGELKISSGARLVAGFCWGFKKCP